MENNNLNKIEISPVVFYKTLKKWYLEHKRDLPWRNTSDPYKIWVSEIILQQTRVQQGLSYYNKFILHFPDIGTLANADEQEILSLWQGLGYYSRARNMHRTARIIRDHFNNVFPQDYDEILKLPGIGTYTAAAIASFAYGMPKAAIDGNVKRVFARLLGIDAKPESSAFRIPIEKTLDKLISIKEAGIFNQAVMEFGALQCLPANPDCIGCPFNTVCRAYKSDMVHLIPARKKAVSIRQRFFYYAIMSYHNNGKMFLLLHKRGKDDIWAHLYELPLLESEKPLPDDTLIAGIQQKFIGRYENASLQRVSGLYRHRLTHQLLNIRFVHLEVSAAIAMGLSANFPVVSVDELDQYPFPIILKKYLRDQI